MNLRRTLTNLLLALAVLLGQQAMLAHAASHLVQPPASQDKQFPHGKACEQCMLSAPLGAGVTSAGMLPLPRTDAADAIANRPAAVLTADTPSFFDSRAPPRAL